MAASRIQTYPMMATHLALTFRSSNHLGPRRARAVTCRPSSVHLYRSAALRVVSVPSRRTLALTATASLSHHAPGELGAAGRGFGEPVDGMADAGSARAQEIARRREEMMGMLRDLPESEYELSLTDLVDNAERKEEVPEPSASGRLAGQQVQPQQQPPQTGKPERRASARRRDSGFRSSSDGVLLHFYMPRSLTRSFTAPRPNRTPSVSGGRTASVASSDCQHKRERDADADTVKCWSLLWDRPWRKSSRRDPAAPPNDNVRAAILKAAKHSA